MRDQANALGSDDHEENQASPIGGGAKRLFDVVFAALGLLLLSPSFLLIALAIKLTDAGPVLYRHRPGSTGGMRSAPPWLATIWAAMSR